MTELPPDLPAWIAEQRAACVVQKQRWEGVAPERLELACDIIMRLLLERAAEAPPATMPRLAGPGVELVLCGIQHHPTAGGYLDVELHAALSGPVQAQHTTLARLVAIAQRGPVEIRSAP